MNLRYLTAVVTGLLSATANRMPAAVFSEYPGSDAFVRAALPDANYGGGGSLAVAGPAATNSGGVVRGACDAFIQFSTATSLASFDAEFGSGQWLITQAILRITEVAEPGNAIFNTAPGAFEIRWISADGWQEGTGKPNVPGNTGLTWNQAASFLTPGTDQTLGQFNSTGTDAVLDAPLSLPAAFISDLRSGGMVSLFLTTASPATGLNFRSRDFFAAADYRPSLVLTAQAIPEPSMSMLLLLPAISLPLKRQRLSPVAHV